MSTDTKLVLGVVVTTGAIITGSIFLMGRNEAATPKVENMGTASMSIDKTSADLGQMRADEEKTATFTITNTSDSTLRIWNVATSCDCTFASVVINGTETGEFNMPMHMAKNLKNWIGEVPSRQTARLLVTYRPKVMPVTGPVTRQVNFSTNDPQNAQVEVSISANVL